MKVHEFATKENAGKKIRIYCGEYSITRTADDLIPDTNPDILNDEVIKTRTTNNGSTIHLYLYPSMKRHKIFNKVRG